MVYRYIRFVYLHTYILTMASNQMTLNQMTLNQMTLNQMTLEEKWAIDSADMQSDAAEAGLVQSDASLVQTNVSMFNPIASDNQPTLEEKWQSDMQSENEPGKPLECYIKRQGEEWKVASRHHICAYIMYDSLPVKEQRQRIVTPHLEGGYFVAKFSETDVPHEYVYVDEYDRRVEIKMF